MLHTYALLQETSANTVLPNGLVQGHAYTVTGVKEVNICIQAFQTKNVLGE